MGKTPKFVKPRQRTILELPQFVAEDSDLLDTHNNFSSLKQKMTAGNATGKCALFNPEKNTGILSIMGK